MKNGHNLDGDISKYGFTADLGSLTTTTTDSLVLATYCCWNPDDMLNIEEPVFRSLNQAKTARQVEFYILPYKKAFDTLLEWLGISNSTNWKQFYLFLRAIMANPLSIYSPSNGSKANFRLGK